jgi:hypothetical protein
MCGIVGVINADNVYSVKRRDYLEQALFTGTLRGVHSTGVFAVPKLSKVDEFLVYKKAIPGSDFIQMPIVRNLLMDVNKYRFIVGHHRQATVGSVSSANAHPFQVDNITLVHNGTLTSTHDLGVDNHLSIAVDSEIIAHAINKHGHEAALPRLQGAFALVWHNAEEDALYLYRNDQRPLHWGFSKESNSAFIASELPMLEWLCWRNDIDMDKYYEVGKHQLLKFTDGFKPAEIKIIKPTEKKVVSIPSNNYGKLTSHTKSANDPILSAEAKRTVKEVLKGLDLEPGDTIKFSFDEWEVRRPASRHGTLRGLMYKEPYCAVAAFGIPVKNIETKWFLEGKVSTCYFDTNVRDWVIVVTDPKNTNEIDSTNLSNTVRRTITKEADKSGDVPAVEQSDQPKEETQTIRGPGGKWISQARFQELIKHGCAACSADLSVGIAPQIAWYETTNGPAPLCPVCATNDSYMEGSQSHLSCM